MNKPTKKRKFRQKREDEEPPKDQEQNHHDNCDPLSYTDVTSLMLES